MVDARQHRSCQQHFESAAEQESLIGTMVHALTAAGIEHGDAQASAMLAFDGSQLRFCIVCRSGKCKRRTQGKRRGADQCAFQKISTIHGNTFYAAVRVMRGHAMLETSTGFCRFGSGRNHGKDIGINDTLGIGSCRRLPLMM
jgi:hypothetical protein